MNTEAIRELVVTIEYLRAVCEHAEGRTAEDTILLTKGMCIGIDVGKKYGVLLPDYQRDSFAAEVYALPTRKIEALPRSITGWVPTEVELPGVGVRVLCLLCGRICIAVRHELTRTDGTQVDVWSVDGSDPGQSWDDSDITHWRSLPEAPK